VLTALGVWLALSGSAAAAPHDAVAHRAHGAPVVRALPVAQLARLVDPAVVDIRTTLAFGQGIAAGTGMIINATGVILTNNHVVEGASRIAVTIPGYPKPVPARVVGVDPAADVAVLEVSGLRPLPTIRAADAFPTLGEPVIAFGNALGLGGKPTVTVGTITGLDRTITAVSDTGESESLQGLLETDAPLAPGDSGGPLVNDRGQVVGMDTAADAGGANVGFAIPITRALAVAKTILAGSQAPGIVLGDQALLGVAVVDRPSGVYVIDVAPGTPAMAAGIAPGDIITTFDNHAVTSGAELARIIHDARPGASATVGWETPWGQSATATVTLATAPVA
jgi:S1-C subfamily serine protease